MANWGSKNHMMKMRLSRAHGLCAWGTVHTMYVSAILSGKIQKHSVDMEEILMSSMHQFCV